MLSPESSKRFEEEINIPLRIFLEKSLKEKYMTQEKIVEPVQIMDAELVEKELAPLDKTKAASIRKAFEPMVKMLGKMEIEAEEIFALEMSKETCGKAKGLGLRIQKVRTAADNKRKEEKSQFLLGGGAVQGFYNIFKAVVTPIEAKLEKVAKHYENLEKKKITDLQTTRAALLEKLAIDGSIMKLGEMSDEVWNNYFTGKKKTHEDEKEATEAATKAEQLKTERNDILQKRKVLLMPYGQFNPFLDLHPETTEEEFQEILRSMVIAKADFDKKQADLLIKQEEIKKENIELKKQVAATPIRGEMTGEEFQKKSLSGLLGKSYVPPSVDTIPVEPAVQQPQVGDLTGNGLSDKEILTNVAISIKERISIVKSKEAKEALELAANTLNIAAMML